MKKAWSFFWLVVASCVAAVIISSAIAPYVGTIVLLVSLIVVCFVGYRVYRFFRRGRGPIFPSSR